MSFETALRSRLKTDLASIVGTRVDWTERPPRTAFPAVVLQVISDDRTQHMGGFDDFRATRVQIDCFATTAKQATELRDAVIASATSADTEQDTEFLRAFVNTVMDRGENSSSGFIHRQLVDMTFWHGAYPS